MVTNFRRDKTPGVTRVSYDLSSFTTIDGRKEQSALSIKNCSYGYNIMLKGGILQTGIGVDEPSYETPNGRVVLPSLALQGENILRLHYYRASHLGEGAERVIALGDNGGFYSTSLLTQGEFTSIGEYRGSPGEDATMLNYYMDGRDTLVIFYSDGLLTYDGERLSKIEGAPILSSAVMLYDRVFGVNGSNLYFSAPLDPTDFSVENGGGVISFMDEGGSLKKIVALGSELYLFREHSVFRLSVLGRPSDYTLQRVLTLSAPFNPHTLRVGGGEMYFTLGTKLYTFNGYTLREIQSGLTALVEDMTEAEATYFDDVYYLSCRLRTEGEEVGDEGDMTPNHNNGVIYFNALTATLGIMRGADIVGFFPILTRDVKEIFIIYGNARAHRAGRLTFDGCIYGTPLEKLYRSAKTNLGDRANLKNLRRVYVDTEHDVELKVTQDGRSAVRAVCDRERGAQNFKLSGYDFCYELRSDGDLFVSGLTLVFDKIRRYLNEPN